MGVSEVYVRPDDWRYRPTREQLERCIAYLRQWDVIQEELTDSTQTNRTFKLGAGADALGLDWDSTERVSVWVSGQVCVRVPPGLDLECPRCHHDLSWDEWSEGIATIMETQTEPAISCGCGDGCPITQAVGRPGFVVHRFCLTFHGCGPTITNQEFIAGLSVALETSLQVTGWKL